MVYPFRTKGKPYLFTLRKYNTYYISKKEILQYTTIQNTMHAFYFLK